MNTPTTITEINLANHCYNAIHRLIINGTLKPGKKLKMKELTTLLETGPSPIREALSRLTASGLVQAHDNKGFYVTQISENNIRDIYHTFLDIELLALKHAIKNGDDTWKASIVAALYRLSLVENDQNNSSLEQWIEQNYEFHLALISGCNSPTLLHIRNTLYHQFDRYCRISFTFIHKQLNHNHEEHQKLTDAVLNRNEKKALEILTHHILNPLTEVISILKKNNLF
jgi:GntR family carbon starvation induced transcriptional regulator